MQHVYIATAPRKMVEVISIDQYGNWLASSNGRGQIKNRESLGLHTCPFCGRKRQENDLCKAEKGIYTIANSFADISSIENLALVKVRSDGQIIMRVESAQRGLTSLFISALAFSGCPKLASISWSWDYYLASANDKDLFYSFFSAFLTAEFLCKREVENGILKRDFVREVSELYEMLRLFVGNIKKLSTNDANLNAFISIIDLATLFSQRTDKYLDHFRRQLGNADGSASTC